MLTLVLCAVLQAQSPAKEDVRPTIALLPPVPVGQAETWVGLAVAENLGTRLLFHSRFDPRTVTRVYPLNVFGWRQAWSAARAEGIDTAKPLDARACGLLREQLGADAIFTGSYRIDGKSVVLQWRLWTDKAAAAEKSKTFELSDVGAATDDIARAVLEGLGQSTRALDGSGLTGLPLAAVRPYAQALEILGQQSLDPRARVVLPNAEIERARSLLSAATDARPDFARAWLARGIADAMLGELPVAEEDMVKAMAAAGEFDPDTSLGVYYLYDRQGDLKKGIAVLEEATTTHLGFLHGLGYLGQAYARASESHESLRVFSTYLARVPKSPWARVKRAEALARTGNHDMAIAETKAVLAQMPDSIMVLTALASRQIDACKYDDARATIQRALAVHPGHPALLTRMSYIELEKGSPEDALRLAEQAVTALGDGRGESLAGYAHVNLAHALTLMGRRDDAIKALRKAKQLGVDANQLLALRRDSRMSELLNDPRNPFPIPLGDPAPAKPDAPK